MTDLRSIYARHALAQIPRLLSNQDRNPYSPTYGCFHRDYWLDKTSDFPDAVRQFSCQALALIYRYDFPGSIYKGQPKIRDWALAGLDFWSRMQHQDGSFDEFYPYERGWVGPSAFTTFTSIEAYHLLHDEMSPEFATRIRETIRRAASFIAAGESEEDHLANHYAMACLAIWKAYDLLGDEALKHAYTQLWQRFLDYHNHEEGWGREYDGVDPGYLSATVSFLAKIYQINPDPAILEVINQAVAFSSYFVYPNGFYGGSLGSRNTLHFYAHGYEVVGARLPLAVAIAEKMLKGLSEDKLVPPAIISDRYVVYRIPEFLQAYLDYTPRPTTLPLLPYEQEPFTRYFPGARVFVATTPHHYTVANLAKGGVVKVFDRHDGRLLLNDCGLIGELSNGQVVTSQWVDPQYTCAVNEEEWHVEGHLHMVPSNKLFTPIKHILFRSALVVMGWNPSFSHALKGAIRKTLMLGRRPVPIRFKRQMRLGVAGVTLTDTLAPGGDVQCTRLSVGDEFFVRYVPQSRYFQSQELEVQGFPINSTDLQQFNQGETLHIVQHIPTTTAPINALSRFAVTVLRYEQLPFRVSGSIYSTGRQRNPQHIYRLNRCTDEVEAALRTHSDGPLNIIVDVGTADGLMLEQLHQRMRGLYFLGFDMSMALLRATPHPDLFKSQSDALHMPIRDGSADAIIATAVIEYVPDAHAMLRECARMLRPGGLLVITTPDPTREQISSTIGLFKEADHQRTFKLHELLSLVEDAGFAVCEARKFMFSPVGFPLEKRIEPVLHAAHLDFMMAHQFVVARKH